MNRLNPQSILKDAELGLDSLFGQHLYVEVMVGNGKACSVTYIHDISFPLRGGTSHIKSGLAKKNTLRHPVGLPLMHFPLIDPAKTKA